jgi:hypothetical protein
VAWAARAEAAKTARVENFILETRVLVEVSGESWEAFELEG